MIGKELLNTRYYFELNGIKIIAKYGYFDSEKGAKDFYIKNIKTLKKDYGERVNNFILIKEETFARRKFICHLSYIKYIVGCDTSIGELFVAMADSIDMPYLSPLKSDVLLSNSFSTKEEAELMMEDYKSKLKPYYKEEILNTMKVLEVKEE